MSIADSSLKDKFTLVFKGNRWGNPESVSGAGSALSSLTVLESVKALDELIRRLNIRSINDVACGDFNWIPLILGRFPKLEYHGFDIVSELIEWNSQRFPDYDFKSWDVVERILPQADLIFCKDLFLHIPHNAIAQVLKNFKASGSRFMLVTSVKGADNCDLTIEEPGAHRHVYLTAEPFSLPPPIWSTGYLSLWSLDALPIDLFDNLNAKFVKHDTLVDKI